MDGNLRWAKKNNLIAKDGYLKGLNKINEVYTNESKKINRIKYLAEKYNLKSENIAYIGDDINDYEVLQYVGLSAAPPQSPILKYLKVDFITERKSGDGSFRDLAELILDSQKIKII